MLSVTQQGVDTFHQSVPDLRLLHPPMGPQGLHVVHDLNFAFIQSFGPVLLKEGMARLEYCALEQHRP
jgi:hypothetical protein